MRTPSWFAACSLVLAGALASAHLASAEPLTPLSSAELRYLDGLHQVFAVAHDPTAFRGDGELLRLGRFVCIQRNRGVAGQAATNVSPVISQLAFLYLCPT